MVNSRLEISHKLEKVGLLKAGTPNNFNKLQGGIVGLTEMPRDELPAGFVGRHNLNVMMDKINALLATEQAMLQEIAASERCCRTMVKNSPDIIVRYDKDCRRVFVNPAYTRETGMSAERVLNKSIDDDDIWRPSMPREEFRRKLQQVMNTGISDRIQLEWTREDGHWACHEMFVVAEYESDGLVTGALAIGRDVTQRMLAEQQLIHQASYDALTGLPNRRLFGDRLREEIIKAERGGYRLALLFVDLDRFKEINDTQGHGVGDRLLVEAAQRIRSQVRESDVVARLAGDEFVVIVPDYGQTHPLARVAKSIVAVMAQPFYLGGQDAYISASIGVAVYPQDAENAETLIGCADRAMYTAKEAGRNGCSFFSRNMLEQTQKRLQLTCALREALAKGQFEVHYQPIIDVASGQTAKAEALLRWRHHELGIVPSDQFIPIAEETGLIHEIGDWVFREAAATVARWNSGVESGKPRQISVNMSPCQIIKGCGDQMVIDHLRDCGLTPAHVAVEITEGLLLEDSRDVTRKLERLRMAGIEMSLDDFGTGYSAMAYLKKIKLDYLKIDQSFVRDMEHDPGVRAITEAIVAMAHRLGLKVVAEGVETHGQFALLEAAGCEYMQGYLFANPMPAKEFLAFAEAGRNSLVVEEPLIPLIAMV